MSRFGSGEVLSNFEWSGGGFGSKTSPMKVEVSTILAIFTVLFTHSANAAEPKLPKLAAANNGFAFKLLKQLTAEQPNETIFISPYSAATALQMAANGAAGQTKAEMQSVLETSGIPPQSLNGMSKAAIALLNSADTNVILTTANALWYRAGAAVKPEFLDINRSFFSSTIKPIDFRNVPAAEAAINQWAREQTHGRIDGIANGMIDPDYTDMVLANAIYFKGKWEDPFDAKLTKDRVFHPATGVAKKVPMMEKSASFNYRKGSGYQAVQLPYMGDHLAMYVFLPDAGSNPAKLLQIMNGDNWQRVTLPGFSERHGSVVLPKFRLEDTLELNAALKAMGMKAAFNPAPVKPSADFSAMFNDAHHLSEVRQKAFVEVNEEGTEAAAVTAVNVPAESAILEPTKPFEMIVDRPFLFFIVDSRSGMILFIGLVNEL